MGERVNRRIGGLEKIRGFSLFWCIVNRRIGGLEIGSNSINVL